MANFTRDGYGQVELNHVSAQATGHIYANLPLDEDVTTLQNGEFMKYDYASLEVSAGDSAIGPWMLVANEVKLYDERKQMMKDFAMINSKDRTSGGTAYAPYMLDGDCPRLFKLEVGDIYTTNMVPTGAEYSVGDIFIPKKNATTKTGQLAKKTELDVNTTLELTVARVYTMPDGQPGLKLMVTKAE